MRSESKQLGYLVLEVGGMLGGIALAEVREILPMARLARPPRLNDVVEGVLNLGGRGVPVLRLDRMLALDGFTPDETSHLIVLKLEYPAALVVGRARDVRQVSADEVRPVTADLTRNGCVTGTFLLGDTPVHVLALKSLLGEHALLLREVA